MNKQAAIEVILAVPDRDGRQSLLKAVENTPWLLLSAETTDEVRELLREKPAQIVVLSPGFADSRWQDTIRSFIAVRRNTNVLLLTSDANHSLRDEVLQAGGFDILAPPFVKEHVLPMLVFAYTQSRVGWPIVRRTRHKVSTEPWPVIVLR